MKKQWGALLLAIPLAALAAGNSAVSASAGGHWEGTDGCGFVVKEGSPVEIEREEIRMRIAELPDPSSGSVTPSYVEASYTFYNPTEEDVGLTLYLPAVDCMYPGCTITAADNVATMNFSGGATGSGLRYTFRSVFSLDAEAEVDRIEDGRRSDPFFFPDLPVRRVRYRLQRTDARDRDFAHLVLKYNPTRTRIFFDNRCGGAKTAVEDGLVRLTWETSLYDCFADVWILGEEAEAVESFVTSDSEAKKRVDDAVFSAEEEMEESFSAFVSGKLSESGLGIGEEDWYNLFVDLLNDRLNHCGLIYVPTEWVSQGRLRTWYEYRLSVPAKERVTAKTVLPLFPTVNERGPVYRYDYLISPAHRFAAFKDLEVHVETPFYLGYSSLSLEEEEGGYFFRREELPIGEFSFTLARSEEDFRAGNSGTGEKLSPNMRLAIIILCVLAGGAVIAGVAAIVAAKKHRRRSR